MVSSTPRPHFTPGKDTVPILQEAGWTAGPVWTGGKSRPYRDSIPDRPARSQSLYRLSYPAHILIIIIIIILQYEHNTVNSDKSVTIVVKWCEYLRRFQDATIKTLLGVKLCVHFLTFCGICLEFLFFLIFYPLLAIRKHYTMASYKLICWQLGQ